MGRNEKPATETALTVIGADLTPAVIYGTEDGKGINAILDKVIAEVRATVIDVSTKAGREAANSLAYKVARSKTLLDDMGKDLVADWKAKSAKVDAERKIIRDRLDALKAEVKQPVDDWEAAEADRVAGHLNTITEIEDLARDLGEPTSEAIVQRQAVLQTIVGEARDWQEFGEQAAAATIMIRTQLAALLEGALKREADARELEALRAEKAERDRKDREAEETRAAEQRRIAAEEVRKHDEEAAAERTRIAAEQAVEAERQRIADAQAAEAEATAKRERNKKHRTRIMATAAAVVKAAANLTDEQAVEVIKVIALGKVPNISIEF